LTLCPDWTLVKTSPSEIDLKKLHCRSWKCDCCGPERRAQVIATVIAGQPNRFLTLTVNPAYGSSPEERRGMLANALKLLVKRLHRWRPGATFEYFAVVEKTLRGEPHLHIALRGPYIPQKLISSIMDELIHAPTVDIRKVDKPHRAAYYLAKYLTKAPEQFGTFKRYWKSRNWEVDPDPEFAKPAPGMPRYKLEKRPRHELDTELMHDGWVRSLFSRDLTKYFPGYLRPPNSYAEAP